MKIVTYYVVGVMDGKSHNHDLGVGGLLYHKRRLVVHAHQNLVSRVALRDDAIPADRNFVRSDIFGYRVLVSRRKGNRLFKIIHTCHAEARAGRRTPYRVYKPNYAVFGHTFGHNVFKKIKVESAQSVIAVLDFGQLNIPTVFKIVLQHEESSIEKRVCRAACVLNFKNLFLTAENFKAVVVYKGVAFRTQIKGNMHRLIRINFLSFTDKYVFGIFRLRRLFFAVRKIFENHRLCFVACAGDCRRKLLGKTCGLRVAGIYTVYVHFDGNTLFGAVNRNVDIKSVIVTVFENGARIQNRRVPFVRIGYVHYIHARRHV